MTFEGHTAQVRDRKGMRHLARLLASPGREIHVLDLVAADAGNPVPGEQQAAGAHLAFGDAGPMLDTQAKQAYRRRLAEIDEDIDDARASDDHRREAQADTEREFLVRELSRAVGLGGRDRRAGSASERARAGVTERSAKQSPTSNNSNQTSPTTSTGPSAPAPTAPTSPTPGSPTAGTSDAPSSQSPSSPDHATLMRKVAACRPICG